MATEWGMNHMRKICLLVALVCLTQCLRLEAGESRALLVGCTRYDYLPPRLHLDGPGNDVETFRALLLERFGFQKENMTVLSDKAGKRPLRKNIVAAFESLIAKAGKGDRLFVFLAGHGSRQPADPDKDDRELDGLDELFLPADARGWKDSRSAVENAITDDEIRAWLKALQAKECFIWVVIDACHSGTMTRAFSGPEERLRSIKPEDLKVDLSGVQAQQRTRGAEPVAAHDEFVAEPGIVAMYAARDFEETPEIKLPKGDPDRIWRGLFSYTLAQTLAQSTRGLSYRALVEEVALRYRAMGRFHPVPVVEGARMNDRVLGMKEWPGQVTARIVSLDRMGKRVQLNVGQLHGYVKGSVFAVDTGEGISAHVKLVKVEAAASWAVPTEFNKHKAPAFETLAITQTCEPAYLAWNAAPLRLRSKDKRGETLLAGLAGDPVLAAMLKVGPTSPEWLLKDKDGVAVLANVQDGLTYTVAPWNKLADSDRPLRDTLTRVARARRLMALAKPGPMTKPLATLHLETKEGKAGGAAQHRLKPGTEVAFRVSNRSRKRLSINLFFVDSQYGITCIFPSAEEYGSNTLEPGASEILFRGEVTPDTVGTEHLVMIALESSGVPQNLSVLEQPSLELGRTRGDDALGSPLGEFLKTALYEQGRHRGLHRKTAASHAIHMVSWDTAKQDGDEPDK